MSFCSRREEIHKRTEKLNSMVKEACPRFTQERFSVVGEEKEDEEAILEDKLERSEVVTDGHRDTQDLKCPLEVATSLPHFISSIDGEVL
ncbi:unnamed protein product [Linum trigynum]|uniref:Uncharacterized protein n=1 Tax=Linum trigynum TaxID=586398 RepID=A0AAV2CUG3_9ROSI